MNDPPTHTATADAPTYRVGDTWRLSNGRIARVLRIEPDGSAIFTGDGGLGFMSCGGACTYRIKDGSLEEINQRASWSGRFLVAIGPGWKFLDYPLAVGKRWSFSGTAVINNQTHHLTVVSHVWSYERVAVKAGSFMAFRLTHQYNGIHPDGIFSNTHVVWYAPEVKFAVKEEARIHTWELVSYSLR